MKKKNISTTNIVKSEKLLTKLKTLINTVWWKGIVIFSIICFLTWMLYYSFLDFTKKQFIFTILENNIEMNEIQRSRFFEIFGYYISIDIIHFIIMHSVKVFAFFILVYYLLSQSFNLKEIILKYKKLIIFLPMIKSIDFIKSTYIKYKTLYFIVMCTLVLLARMSYWMTNPTRVVSDLVIFIFIFLFSIGYYVYNNKTSENFIFLSKIPVIKNLKIFKNFEPDYYKITEGDLNLTYVIPKYTPEILKNEKSLNFLKNNLWVFFVFTLLIPSSIYQDVILLLYLFISYITIYWVYLNVKLINLKTNLFINEIDRDFDGFLFYKSNFIKSNRYLQGQVWATQFTVDYQQYMLNKRGIQVRTPVTISSEKVKAFASWWQTKLTGKNILTGTAILGGAASFYQAITVSDHVSRPGQVFDLKRYGYYHPRTEIFENFRALESGGFIRPQDRHMFIDENGLLKAGHVRESYLDLIGDGSKASTNVEFQQWKNQRMLEQKTYRGSLTPPDVLPPRMTPATAAARDAIGGIPTLLEAASAPVAGSTKIVSGGEGIKPFTPAEAISGGIKKV